MEPPPPEPSWRDASEFGADDEPRVLVTGGSGFLGRHLVDALLARGERVRVFDRVQSFEVEDASELVEFVIGDVRCPDDVRAACRGVRTIFHCAAYTEPWGSRDDFFGINVGGTRNVVEAALAGEAERLVFTSTGSVVIDGTDIKMGDESLPYPRRHLDLYSSSKAEAERIVLGANGEANSAGAALSTCSLRPHAMFGPRDSHFIAQLVAKAREGDITHMIGDGLNVCDFTYVANAVHAHLLVADQLSPGHAAAGQAYFITNGEPRRFWDFIATVLRQTGCVGPTKTISFRVAYSFAYVMEFLHWVFGRLVSFRPTITRHMVCTMACHHWFSHSKATRDFGYRPVVSLDEGLRETVDYFSQLVRTGLQAGGSSLAVAGTP